MSPCWIRSPIFGLKEAPEWSHVSPDTFVKVIEDEPPTNSSILKVLDESKIILVDPLIFIADVVPSSTAKFNVSSDMLSSVKEEAFALIFLKTL